jgi:hypothetical protein
MQKYKTFAHNTLPSFNPYTGGGGVKTLEIPGGGKFFHLEILGKGDVISQMARKFQGRG